MRMDLRFAVRTVLGASVAMAASPAASGQEARPELEEVVVVGTRTAGHDVYESLAPIDLVTSDDSVVQRMVDAGLLTARQAQHHPKKNQLIAALGIQDAVEPHTLAQPVPIEEGDAFLLCSDGWWDSLEESVIADTLSDASSPDEWLTAMQRHIEAQDHPKQDNFSAVAVWVGDPGATTRIMGDVTLP